MLEILKMKAMRRTQKSLKKLRIFQSKLEFKNLTLKR